jgi:foldase protein PrsA
MRTKNSVCQNLSSLPVALVFAAYTVAAFALGADPPVKDLPKDAGKDEVVARVNGVGVTRTEYVDALRLLYGREVLERQVNTLLLRQEAEHSGIPLGAAFTEELQRRAKDEVDASLDRRAKERGYTNIDDFAREYERTSGEAFSQWRERLTDQARVYIEPQVLSEKVLKQRIQISDEQILDEFDITYGPKAYVQQVVLRTQNEADEALNRIKAGADFRQVVKEQSIDPVSRVRDGIADPLPRKGSLGEAAFALDEGQISAVVKGDEGFHIMKLLRKIPAQNVKYEDVKDKLRTQLLRREVDRRITELLADLHRKGKVEILDPMAQRGR